MYSFGVNREQQIEAIVKQLQDFVAEKVAVALADSECIKVEIHVKGPSVRPSITILYD